MGERWAVSILELVADWILIHGKHSARTCQRRANGYRQQNYRGSSIGSAHHATSRVMGERFESWTASTLELVAGWILICGE